MLNKSIVICIILMSSFFYACSETYDENTRHLFNYGEAPRFFDQITSEADIERIDAKANAVLKESGIYFIFINCPAIHYSMTFDDFYKFGQAMESLDLPKKKLNGFVVIFNSSSFGPSFKISLYQKNVTESEKTTVEYIINELNENAEIKQRLRRMSPSSPGFYEEVMTLITDIAKNSNLASKDTKARTRRNLSIEERSDLYNQAFDLLKKEKFDEAILLLLPQQADPQGKLLLAEAYLGKSSLMQLNGDEGYDRLIEKANEIGKDLALKYYNRRDLPYVSEMYYIRAYGYMINNRLSEAATAIEKAVEFSPSPTPESRYYLVWGSANASLALGNNDRLKYIVAKTLLEEIIEMDAPNDHKALSYYWLGALYSRFENKKEAIEALNTAVDYAEKHSTRIRILKQLASIQ